MNHLSIPSLGKLLRLATRAWREQTGAGMNERWETDGPEDGELQSATRDLHLFLSALSREERKDVWGLYGLGRWADSFECARENPGHAIELTPFILSERLDLQDSIIAGLKRLGEPGVLSKGNGRASAA